MSETVSLSVNNIVETTSLSVIDITEVVTLSANNLTEVITLSAENITEVVTLSATIITEEITLLVSNEAGPVGRGVAAGGTAGQFLQKNSGINYDTVWVDIGFIADPAGSALSAQNFAIQRVNHTGTQDVSTITGLAPVATSGSYTDLTNTPSIPAAQVNSDWNSVSGVSQILNKPILGTLASQNGTFSGISSGTNTGDQTITLTGDLMGSGVGSFATTIDNNVVTNSKLSQVPTATIKGRLTTGTGNVEDLTVSQTKTLLALVKGDVGLGNVDNTSDVNKPVSTAQASAISSVQSFVIQRVNHTGTQDASTVIGLAPVATSGSYTDLTNKPTIPAAQVNSDWNSVSGVSQILNKPTLGTLASQNGTFSGISSGTNTGDQTITLTGDVTGSGVGSFAATIPPNSVTNAKLGTVASSTFKGRASAGTGSPEDLTVAQAKTLLALVKSDVGLGNVDNTSDVNKPVSTAQASADSAVQALAIQRVNHTGTQTASTISDFNSVARAQTEAELIAGANITITPAGSGVTRTLTIASTGGTGVTNLTTTAAPTSVTVNSDTGTDAVISAADNTNAGLFLPAEKTKLTAISGTNTGDQTISITGDVTAAGSTGSLSATVTKINGTTLSGLATGILKNTTGTGVPSIAIAGTDYLTPTGAGSGLTSLPTNTTLYPVLNQNTNGTASNVTGIVLGANGGTGVANTDKTITLGGNLTTSGAFATILTTTASTNVTLPTTGTLATTSDTAAVQAFSIQRVNHTGTQSADTIVDGTTNKVFTSTEKTKLAAITGTNTGDQTAGTISNTPAGNIAATTVQAAINELDSEKQGLNTDLTTISGLTPTNDDIIQRKVGVWTNRTPAQFKVDLTLVKSDVGLGNVDNTSDVNKPVSTAQASADSAVQAIAIQRVNHTGTQTSSTISDFNSAARAQTEAELIAGTNVTITPAGSGATRTLTITAASNVTNLTTTAAPTTVTVNSSTGTGATIAAADSTNAGLFLPAEKTKLTAITGTNTGDQNLTPFLASNTWIGLTVGAVPTTSVMIAAGEVLTYFYGVSTRYRFISNDGLQDSYYTGFDGTNLTGLVATKSLVF